MWVKVPTTVAIPPSTGVLFSVNLAIKERGTRSSFPVYVAYAIPPAVTICAARKSKGEKKLITSTCSKLDMISHVLRILHVCI